MLCPTCQSPNPDGAPSCRSCGSPLAQNSASAQSQINAIDPDAPDALPAGTLLGGLYEIERVLGQGGFGITYACHDTLLQRKVAVKEFFPFGCRRDTSQVLPSRSISPTDFTSARDKFLDEARILAACSHRSIVAVHTAFSENNTAYMVMELLQGQTLGDALAHRGGRLPEDETVTLAKAIGDALSYVHDRGLLHRDLKPENIMLCDDGRVMLIDFGTAREYSKGHLQVRGHTVVVTPGYAPLEQYAQQARRGPYTDIYALCALLYHLLTGQVPAAASDRAMGVLLSPVRELNPRVSKRVARAVETGLQIEVDKRPQSVSEFLGLLHTEVEPAKSKSSWGDASPLQAEAKRILREKQNQHKKHKEATDISEAEFIQRYLSPPKDADEESIPIGGIVTEPHTQTRQFVTFPDALQAAQSLLQDATDQTQAAAPPASTQPTLSVPATAVGAGTSIANPATAALQTSLLNDVPDSASAVSLTTPIVGAPTTLQKSSSQTPVPNAQNAGGIVHRDQESPISPLVGLCIGLVFLLVFWLLLYFAGATQPQYQPAYRPPTSFSSQSSVETESMDPSEQEKNYQKARYERELNSLTKEDRESIQKGPFASQPHSVQLPARAQQINSASLSPNRRVLAYAEPTEQLVVWDMQKQQLLRTVDITPAYSLAFSEKSDLLAGTSQNQSFFVVDIKSGKLYKPNTNLSNSIKGIEVHAPNLVRILSLSEKETGEWPESKAAIETHTFNITTGLQDTITTRIQNNPMNNLFLHPVWDHMLVEQDDTILIYDLKSSKLLHKRRLKPSYSGPLPYPGDKVSWGVVQDIASSDDGSKLAIAQETGDLTVLNAQFQRLWGKRLTPLQDGYKKFTPMAFSPSGRWLATFCDGIRIWDSKTGRLIQYFEPSPAMQFVNVLGFSSDEKDFFALYSDGELRTWRLKTAARKFLPQKTPSQPAPLHAEYVPVEAPAPLLAAYENWKTAHASSSPEYLLSFYIQEQTSPEPYLGMSRSELVFTLRNHPGKNWKQIEDAKKPVVFRTSDGYLMYAHLNYFDGWDVKQAFSERRLHWVKKGDVWLIASDKRYPYQHIERADGSTPATPPLRMP